MRPIAQTKLPLVCMVVVFSLAAYGHRISPFPILPNSSVFIDPMDGFGPELEKAFLQDGLRLVIVSDQKAADFEITGGIRDGEPTSIESMTWGGSEQQADVHEPRPRFFTVAIVSLKTGDLAWGYGMSGITDPLAAADSCAKQLKDKIKLRR